MSTIQACWLDKTGTVSQALDDMLSASDYWQPDNQSQWTSDNHAVGLAKAQLYNTARAQKDGIHHEPVLGLSISSHARIDNRDTLLKQLALDDTNPSIQTDGQLILHCYAKWGSSCASHLRGDFVFIIWDESKQKLFCARDHFGVKVLFYAQNNKGIMLSNEHNAFFTSSWCDKNNVNERWLVQTLWNLVPKDFESPNPDIKVLPPAHTLEIDQQGVKLTQYWYLEPKKNWRHLNDEALIEELKVRFQHAVGARLDSQYPLGTELSEGLDSNGITGFAARHVKPKTIHTFSYSCEALTDKNRSVWAATYKGIEAMLAMHENLEPVWQTRSTDDQKKQARIETLNFYKRFGGVIPYGGNLQGQLLQDKNIRVLLSGWGGDQCVSSSGDEYGKQLWRSGRILSLYQLFKGKYARGRGRHPLLGLLVTAILQLVPPLNLHMKMRRGLELTMRERAKRHFLQQKWVSRFKLEATLNNFLRNYHRATVQQYEIRELFEIGLTNRLTQSELSARQFRVDYRFPMLDVDLVEFAHSLPSRLKIHQGIERYPFRRVVEGVTTQRNQWRTKADIVAPKIDRKSTIETMQHRLARGAKCSKLVGYYGGQETLEKYLKSKSIVELRSLELMLDIEDYYVISTPKDV